VRILRTLACQGAQRGAVVGKSAEQLISLGRCEAIDGRCFSKLREPSEMTSGAGKLTKQCVAVGAMARLWNGTKSCLTDVARDSTAARPRTLEYACAFVR
jgi:hypothetical protein